MPIPDFLADLRTKVGHDHLWLSGVCAVTFDAQGRVLLTKRSDNGRWALVSGIIEPGDDPISTVVRELQEETGIEGVVERLLSVTADGPFDYPNGDQASYLTLTYRCHHVSGEARCNDDESTEVGWFALDDLPPLSEREQERLRLALQPRPENGLY